MKGESIHYPDTSQLKWRLTSDNFSAQVTAFLIEATPNPKDHAHTAHMLTMAGPENAVRSLTAFCVGSMSHNSGALSSFDERGARVETFMIKRPIHRSENDPPVAEWSRPTPIQIRPGLYEGAAYSRLMDIKYVPTDDPGHTFIVTAEHQDELPGMFYKWAKLRLPAPMLPQWAEPIYRQGIMQGQIKELHSHGMVGVLSVWKPDDLRETVRVMGLLGKLPRPLAHEQSSDGPSEDSVAPACLAQLAAAD